MVINVNTLNKVLDKARVLCGSDAGIARRLKVTPSAVSLWRSGGKIKPEHLAVLLDFAQQDPALAVQVMAEQDASPEERRMWGTVWDRLSPVTSTVAGALLVFGLDHVPRVMQTWSSGVAMHLMSRLRRTRLAVA